MLKKNYGWHRLPRTTQERRVTGKRNKWGRARRNARNLPDSYDDRPTCVQKTWKVKRKKQYHENGRGQEHKIFLPEDGSPRWMFWVNTWELEEWFVEHDIPHCLRKIEHIEVHTQHYREKYVCVGYREVPYLRRERPRKNGARKTETKFVESTRWESIYEWRRVKLAKPRTYRTAKLLGYELTWWSNRNIGINQLLQRFSRQ